MFRGVFLVFMVLTVSGIIVKDPLPTGEEYVSSYDVEYPTADDKNVLGARLPAGAVSGAYSALDPDGIRRTVHYVTDSHFGFKAVLVHEPLQILHSNPLEQFDINDFHPNYPPRSQYAGPYSSIPLRYFKRGKYFTPANELISEKASTNGLYFEPNYKRH